MNVSEKTWFQTKKLRHSWRSSSYSRLQVIKNEFDFLNCYLTGNKLSFEEFQLFRKSWMLRSEHINDNFTLYCFSMKVQLLVPIPKFLMVFDYSYFDKFGGGVFEEDPISFRENFLKKYVIEDVDKRIDELKFIDHKLLHMINI